MLIFHPPTPDHARSNFYFQHAHCFFHVHIHLHCLFTPVRIVQSQLSEWSSSWSWSQIQIPGNIVCQTYAKPRNRMNPVEERKLCALSPISVDVKSLIWTFSRNEVKLLVKILKRQGLNDWFFLKYRLLLLKLEVNRFYGLISCERCVNMCEGQAWTHRSRTCHPCWGPGPHRWIYLNLFNLNKHSAWNHTSYNTVRILHTLYEQYHRLVLGANPFLFLFDSYETAQWKRCHWSCVQANIWEW